MKHIKSINENDEDYTEVYNEKLEDVKKFISEHELDAEVELDVDAPEIVVNLKKSNNCFNSDNMDKILSHNFWRMKNEGQNKSGFMGNYTLLEEMSDQISVIDSIITSLTEDFDMSLERCYIAGNDIRMEFGL